MRLSVFNTLASQLAKALKKPRVTVQSTLLMILLFGTWKPLKEPSKSNMTVVLASKRIDIMNKTYELPNAFIKINQDRTCTRIPKRAPSLSFDRSRSEVAAALLQFRKLLRNKKGV